MTTKVAISVAHVAPDKVVAVDVVLLPSIEEDAQDPDVTTTLLGSGESVEVYVHDNQVVSITE